MLNAVTIGGFLLFLLLICWLILLEIRLRKLKKFQQEIFTGTNARNLEEALSFYIKEIKSIKNNLQDIEKFCRYLNQIAEKSFYKSSLIRFNPFSDTGGDQSFSIALLDHHNNGLVISSLHGREGTRIYAKPIVGGKSKYNLSREEIQAIEKAIGKIK